MDRPGGVLLLVSVCFLLVLVLGAIESGRLVGANYTTGLSILNINFSWIRPYHPPNGTTNTGSGRLTYPNGSSIGGLSHTSTTLNQNPFALFAPLALPAIPDWLLTILAVACFAGACLLVLRFETRTSVTDLEETIKEMELQQKRLAEAWSYGLRNTALLRYYLLMRRACSGVGLQEGLTETPTEYIERASSFLRVDKTEAAKFAGTVNRCRYGEELSVGDANDASKFMRDFTDVIRRRANEP
jgi:hypothetical protein